MEATAAFAVPVQAMERSLMSRPVTASVKVSVWVRVVALVGPTVLGTMLATVGAVWSRVMAAPAVYPPLIALPALSWIPVPEPLRSSRIVPSPVTDVSVTV